MPTKLVTLTCSLPTSDTRSPRIEKLLITAIFCSAITAELAPKPSSIIDALRLFLSMCLSFVNFNR